MTAPPPLPCDRCGTVTRLTLHRREALCPPCRDGVVAAAQADAEQHRAGGPR